MKYKKMASQVNAGNEAEQTEVQKLLERYGIRDAAAPRGGQGGGDASLADEVARVCEAALRPPQQAQQDEDDVEDHPAQGEGRRCSPLQCGRMLLLHDVFCLVNRARGTDLVSPEDVMAALRQRCIVEGSSSADLSARSAASSGQGGQGVGPEKKNRLRLVRLGRKLGAMGSVLAVQLAQTKEAEVDEEVLRVVQSVGKSGISAPEFAKRGQVAPSVASWLANDLQAICSISSNIGSWSTLYESDLGWRAL